jgi:hypothetical protein
MKLIVAVASAILSMWWWDITFNHGSYTRQVSYLTRDILHQMGV